MAVSTEMLTILIVVAAVGSAIFVASRRKVRSMPADFRRLCSVETAERLQQLTQGLEKSKIPFQSTSEPASTTAKTFMPTEIFVSEMNLNAAKTVLARLKVHD